MSAQILHPNRTIARGPFLIDQTQLESLDTILSGEWARMEKAREEEVDADAEKEFSKMRAASYNGDKKDEELRKAAKKDVESGYRFRVSRNFLLLLRDGRNASVQDFGSALRDPALNDQVVTAFSVTLKSGERLCRVELDQYGLEIKVEPRGDSLMDQTFIVLKNWHMAVCPPIWLRIWSTLAGYHWFLVIMLLAFGSAMMANRGVNALKHKRAEQAAILNEEGIEPREYGEALSLLLSDSFSLNSAAVTPTSSSRWQATVAVVLVCGILLSFVPKDLVGIGAGSYRISRWRWYTRLVLVGVPLWIFSTYVWPLLDAVIRAIFSGS